MQNYLNYSKEVMSNWRKLLAEFIGTYALVFCATGSIIVDGLQPGMIGHLGVSFIFGFIIMVMIFAVGAISGAHFNPVVSVAFWMTGHFPAREVPSYILTQLAAAAAGSFTLMVLFPDTQTFGETLPSGTVAQSFLMEVILTFFLVFVILFVATAERHIASFAAIAIGGTVFLAAAFGGPVSGASMNPARSFGPALAAANFSHFWLYIAAPMVGSAVAALTYRAMRVEKTTGKNAEV